MESKSYSMKYMLACLLVLGAFLATAFWIMSPVPPHDDNRRTPATAASLPAWRESMGHTAAKPVVPSDVPSVAIDERKFDFGLVDSLRMHRHTFEIRNAGTAPLTLLSHGTTCKCLTVEVVDEKVAPGEAGKVVVIWDAQEDPDAFLQRVSVVTNDPRAPIVDLEVAGKVRIALAAEPATLFAGRLVPGEQAQAVTTIVSRVWDAFTIEAVESTLTGIQWSRTPADVEKLRKLKAKSGWRLAVTLPPDMPTGSFQEALQITVRPRAQDSRRADAGETAAAPMSRPESVVREVPLEGEVLGRLSVYGKDMRSWGRIEAGTIDPRRGYRTDLVIKVNDSLRQLGAARIETTPAFVKAKITPYEAAQKPGLYRLQVRIPADGQPGAYRGDREGKILLMFDHPRIESLELCIEFVVVKDAHRRLSSSARARSSSDGS